ncbi:hypothetical protein O5833_28960, partial [Escherichia coli]|nr:hypothetical protein [Escherichia coli]
VNGNAPANTNSGMLITPPPKMFGNFILFSSSLQYLSPTASQVIGQYTPPVTPWEWVAKEVGSLTFGIRQGKLFAVMRPEQ